MIHSFISLARGEYERKQCRQCGEWLPPGEFTEHDKFCDHCLGRVEGLREDAANH